MLNDVLRRRLRREIIGSLAQSRSRVTQTLHFDNSGEVSQNRRPERGEDEFWYTDALCVVHAGHQQP